ncbi:flavonol sulfotransferase-like protein [Carex littledalei]|uniref:Sulfotransferase n=1 Tax=Carex littledalei TaxID=544730 RepID=A0A833VGE6_9POAL|nr:flavonol sulfotransferase-like protein [Carex littledalei]
MAVEDSKQRPRPTFSEIPTLEEGESKNKELVLTLPVEQGWVASAIRQHQGFWVWERVLPGILTMQEVFKHDPNDIIVASLPKSGTTWLKALTFTIVHRSKFSFSDHPLLKFNPHDCVPVLDHTYAGLVEQNLKILPSPRVLGTHTPYSFLPEIVKTSDCPIIYLCRETKDVLVSFWHMLSARNSIPFNQAFELFCEGRAPYGPIWDHVLEYYTISLHNQKKVLFLKYEEMMNDPIEAVTRLADFIGCPFTEEEVKQNVVVKVVEFCSFNKLKDLDVNKNNSKNDFLFRKAVVGDWQNYITAEMATKLDKITEERLQDSGFTY